MVAHGGKPSIHVAPGFHRIEGRFSWAQLPEFIDFDSKTGLIELNVEGKRIPFPRTEGSGRLWIRQAARPAMEQDALEIRVFRKYEDNRPAFLTTRVELEISGKNREIVVGPVLPSEFQPVEVTGDLPLQWEQGSMLRFQGRPGSWAIVVRSRCSSRLTQITRPEAKEPWPAEEIWTVVTRPEVRQVTVENLAKLDPNQKTIRPRLSPPANANHQPRQQPALTPKLSRQPNSYYRG